MVAGSWRAPAAQQPAAWLASRPPRPMAAAARRPSRIGVGTVLRWVLLLLGAIIILPWCALCSSPGPSSTDHASPAACLIPWTRRPRACRDPKVHPGPLLRDDTPTPADEPQETATYTREVLYFPCSGLRCQAWLYMPTGSGRAKPPVVVAAHGLGVCCAVVQQPRLRVQPRLQRAPSTSWCCLARAVPLWPPRRAEGLWPGSVWRALCC